MQEQSDLHVRIAINTGEALVILSANPAQGEHIASGDVLNTAARLQAAAPVDGILVGEQTYRANERVVEYGEHEPLQAKGKARRVRVWEVRQARSRFGVDVQQSPRTALIGRERELRLLTEAFERASAALLREIGHRPAEAYARLRAGGDQLNAAFDFYRSVGATRYIREAESRRAASA